MTNFPTFTVTRKGEPVTFTSAFETLADAFHSLDAHANKSQFATDLLQAARERRLSEKQAAWIHKLATDGAKPTERPVVEGLYLGDILTMMDKAAEAQKRNPKIVLRGRWVDAPDTVLTRCGERSRTPGAINVTDGKPYGENVFYGRIERDGMFYPSRSSNGDIEALLRDLEADPATVASQHGIAVGQCCFCNRPLSTKESRSVGYGPICAERYGLPWGKVSNEVEAAHTKAMSDAQPVQHLPAEDPESTVQRLQDEDTYNPTRYDPNAGIREWRRRNSHRISHP